MLVHAWQAVSDDTVIVEIVIDCNRGDLPDFTLPFLARALSFHEHLHSNHDSVAREGWLHPPWQTPRQFLLRTMDPRLYAFQSIVLGAMR